MRIRPSAEKILTSLNSYEAGDSTTINARIVSIESGESIAAEDASIKIEQNTNQDVHNNPKPSDNSDKSEMPAKEKLASTDAGNFTGKHNDFGLFGIPKYKIAWREFLGKQPIHAFSAGDVLGNGTSRLVMLTTLRTLYLHLTNPIPDTVTVMKWENNKFKKTWQGDVNFNTYASNFIKVIPLKRHPAAILASGDYVRTQSYALQWNGSTYTWLDWKANRVTLYTDVFTNGDIVELACTSGGSVSIQRWNVENFLTDEGIKINVLEKQHFSPVIRGDFDGDHENELVMFQTVDYNRNPIEIYDLHNNRKAITSGKYDACLALWQPNGITLPYIVAAQNTRDDNKQFNGGYFCFVQWDGEAYNEVFKSQRFGDAVIDIQVCDPKDEKQSGLIIISMDKNGYYLTKVVPNK